jgi:drug/metabolite transporter (DMT)-like permease
MNFIKTNAVKGGFSAVGAIFSWSLSGLIIKMGLSQIEPACHVFLRLAVASIIVGGYWYFTQKHPSPQPSPTSGERVKITDDKNFNRFQKPLVWIFLILIMVNTFVQTYAIRGVPYSWYVILFAFQPILALAVIDSKTLLRKSVFGVLIAFSGVLLFVNTKHLSIAVSAMQLSMVFFAMCTWTAYTFLVNKLNAHFSGLEIALMTIMGGMVAAFIAILFIPLIHPIDFSFMLNKNTLLMQIFATGILTTLIYGLYSTGLRFAPTLTVILQYIDPLMGCVLAFIFLHETLSSQQIAGGFFIITGIYLTKRWMQTATDKATESHG